MEIRLTINAETFDEDLNAKNCAQQFRNSASNADEQSPFRQPEPIPVLLSLRLVCSVATTAALLSFV